MSNMKEVAANNSDMEISNSDSGLDSGLDSGSDSGSNSGSGTEPETESDDSSYNTSDCNEDEGSDTDKVDEDIELDEGEIEECKFFRNTTELTYAMRLSSLKII